MSGTCGSACGDTHAEARGAQKPTLSQAGALAQTCFILPASQFQIHTFWVDTKNYVEVTRKWYAEAMPFPLNFFLPGRMQRQFMERLQLLCGEHRPENEEELEKEVPLGQGAAVGEEPQRRRSRMGVPRMGGGSVPAAVSPPHVLSTVVPRGSGMPDPALPAPGLSEILLWRRVSLSQGKDRWFGRRCGFRCCRRDWGGSGAGQEVLGTDTGPDDSGAVCEVGGLPGTGGACRAVGHSMCPLCSPGIESHSGPGWRHLGSPLCTPGPEPGVLSSPGGPLLPEPTSQGPLFFPLYPHPFCHSLSPALLSAPAPPPWMPLSLATWPCCCRPGCPAGSCRPTCGGCRTSVPTARTSSASTSRGMEVRAHGARVGPSPGAVGRAPGTSPLPTFLPCSSAEGPPPRQTPAGPETEEEPYRRRNQVLSVLAGLAAMVGYALLSGIVSIQRTTPARAPGTRSLSMAEEDEEE